MECNFYYYTSTSKCYSKITLIYLISIPDAKSALEFCPILRVTVDPLEALARSLGVSASSLGFG